MNKVDLNFMKLSVKVPAFSPQRLSSFEPDLYYSSLIKLLEICTKESQLILFTLGFGYEHEYDSLRKDTLNRNYKQIVELF
jgi:hypothetical protein